MEGEMLMGWKKGISKTGKFPKKAFAGILQAIYPSENANGTKLLQLDFEDDIQVGIYGIGKAQITNDGIEVSGSLAEFQASLEALGYQCMWGTDDQETEIMGFKTEPDIIGCKVHMQPLEEQTVGDDSQTKKSIFWGIVTKVEHIQTPKPPAVTKEMTTAPRPGKLPKKPQTKEPEPSNVDITNIVIDALTEPKTISELFMNLGKKHKVSELRAAIESLKARNGNQNKWKIPGDLK